MLSYALSCCPVLCWAGLCCALAILGLAANQVFVMTRHLEVTRLFNGSSRSLLPFADVQAACPMHHPDTPVALAQRSSWVLDCDCSGVWCLTPLMSSKALSCSSVQVRSPTMSTHLLVPLPLTGSETSRAAQDQPGSTMHVRVCADNVCSLQVWH